MEIPKWKYPRLIVLYEDDKEISVGMRSHGYNGCGGVCWRFSQVFKKDENLLDNIEKWYKSCEEATANWWVPYNKAIAGELILPSDILILDYKK
jgi:hypothetical protein